ncbi:MAG: hypothetical protein DRJ42_07000 [Deltaproteobacteria bacterium]|nr:MAG: hypothetical protein DRJ42_07000 [Deltaproteobacteria bacterium]
MPDLGALPPGTSREPRDWPEDEMSTPTEDNMPPLPEAEGLGKPSPNGTRLVLGLLAAVVIIAALSTWAVYADRRARPGTPPQTAEDAGVIGDDGQPTPPADDGVGGATP